MLKFLLDENVPPAIGVFLQSLDFDVVHAKDSGLLEASDKQFMDLARQEERTLITFDKHFADLVLYPPGTHWGVIRIRIHPPQLSDVIQALDQFLKQFDMSTIQGALIVLQKDGFRIRRASFT